MFLYLEQMKIKNKIALYTPINSDCTTKKSFRIYFDSLKSKN